MKTNYMKQVLPLAAIILVAAGCDPFPAKPGGNPQVVRVTTADQSGTGTSNVVENSPPSAGTLAVPGAYPRDSIYIQFNKPMNGSTIQYYKDVDANGNPTLVTDIDPASWIGGDPANGPVLPTKLSGVPYVTCRPAAGLTLTGFAYGEPVISDTLPGAPTYLDDHASDHLVPTTVCYDPGSTTDGANIVVTPGAPMVVGTDYRITGSVQDYQGKSVTVDVTVTVDPMTFAQTTDGYQNWGSSITYAYSMAIDWFPTFGATTYTVEYTPDPVATTSTWTAIVTNQPAASICDPIVSGFCEVWHTDATPATTYWYRVKAGTGAFDVAVSGDTLAPLKVALDNYPGAPATPNLGEVKINWTRVYDLSGPVLPGADFLGAVEYLIERAPNVAGATAADDAPGTWAEVFRKPVLEPTVADPLDTPFVERQWLETGLANSTKYWYRVTPVYGAPGNSSATVKGTPVSHTTPAP